MTTSADRQALVEEHQSFVLEQIAHMKRRGHAFDEWVVLFITIDDGDEEAKRLARTCGWSEGSEQLVSTLVERANLCRVMRELHVFGLGPVERPIRPGKIRCVVVGRGCGVHDVDVPVNPDN